MTPPVSGGVPEQGPEEIQRLADWLKATFPRGILWAEQGPYSAAQMILGALERPRPALPAATIHEIIRRIQDALPHGEHSQIAPLYPTWEAAAKIFDALRLYFEPPYAGAALPAPAFSETIQRAIDVFRDGTEENLGEWRMREGRVFVDELTRLVEGAALPPQTGNPPPLESWHKHECRGSSSDAKAHDPCFCVCGAVSNDRGKTWTGAALPEPEPPVASLRPVRPSADAEALARRFHEIYECLAPQFNYKTRTVSAVPWASVPENNRALMVAVAAEILRGAALPPQTGNPPLDYLPPDHDEMMEIPFEERYAVTNFPYTKPSNPNNAIIGPTYYVGHPDGSFTPADPQPSLRAPQSGPWTWDTAPAALKQIRADAMRLGKAGERIVLLVDTLVPRVQHVNAAGSGAETPPQPEIP